MNDVAYKLNKLDFKKRIHGELFFNSFRAFTNRMREYNVKKVETGASTKKISKGPTGYTHYKLQLL